MTTRDYLYYIMVLIPKLSIYINVMKLSNYYSCHSLRV